MWEIQPNSREPLWIQRMEARTDTPAQRHPYQRKRTSSLNNSKNIKAASHVVTSTRVLWKCLQFKSYARLMFWTRSHVAQVNPIFTRDKTNPELLILLPPIPRCWGHRCMPPHTVGVFFVCLLYHIYLFTYFVCTYMYITHTVAWHVCGGPKSVLRS